MTSPIYTRKKWTSYVPWIAIYCFLQVTVGMIVWAVGTNRALSSTNKALHLLGVEEDSTFSLIRTGATGAVVVCVVMSLLMVLLSLSRKSLEKKIDLYGKAVCGTWLYLAVEALMSAIWWFILFWLVFVIFGGCLWYGAAYTIEGAIALTLSEINLAVKKGNYDFTAVMASLSTLDYCPSTCFNMGYFSYYYTSVDQQNTCLCDSAALQLAYRQVDSATYALNLFLVGSFLMWVGASFVLMNAVGAFASTRRERELLMRAQRNAQEVVNAQLALGVAGPVGRMPDNPMYYSTYKDTQPLLGLQQQQYVQMQMAQMAQTQQQMQQQMQQPGVGMPGAPVAAGAGRVSYPGAAQV